MWAQVGRTNGYLPPNAVNVLNYFPHLQPAHGAFRYIPGSHRQAVFATADQARKPHPQEQLLYPKWAIRCLFTAAYSTLAPATPAMKCVILSLAFMPNVGILAENRPTFHLSNLSWLKLSRKEIVA